MIQILKLFLPVVFPSWRFFSAIGPSPRIEYTFSTLADNTYQESDWQPLLLLPLKLSWSQAFWRFVHNPHWNEQLYLNTCAEHLFEGYSAFFDQEIGARLCAKVARGELFAPASAQFVVYRLRAVFAYETYPKDKVPAREEVTFISQAYALPASSTPPEVK